MTYIICVSKLTIIGSDNGLSPSHYLKQCWNIINWTHRNKLQLYFKPNSNIFVQEIAFENVVYKMAFILSRPHVKWLIDFDWLILFYYSDSMIHTTWYISQHKVVIPSPSGLISYYKHVFWAHQSGQVIHFNILTVDIITRSKHILSSSAQ